jgi:hypothetical protein
MMELGTAGAVVLYGLQLAVGILVGVLAVIARNLLNTVEEMRRDMGKLELSVNREFVRADACKDRCGTLDAKYNALDASVDRMAEIGRS